MSSSEPTHLLQDGDLLTLKPVDEDWAAITRLAFPAQDEALVPRRIALRLHEELVAQVQARKAAEVSLWNATTKLEELISEFTDMEDELDQSARQIPSFRARKDSAAGVAGLV